MEQELEFHTSTFISLIPRKKGVVEITIFRSISFVGNIYKLLSKVLTLRLKELMDELILQSQFVFVRTDRFWIVP